MFSPSPQDSSTPSLQHSVRMSRAKPTMKTELISFTVCLGATASLAQGTGYVTPEDIVLPPASASEAALKQSTANTGLRFAGMDLFPHVGATVMYDDNVLISENNRISDVEWTFSPGMTVVAGDVSTYLPGSVTLSQLRGLRDYSLVEDTSRPERYLGLDGTLGANFFTDHSDFNNVDSWAGLSAGYALSRLSLGLDYDFSWTQVKDNDVGTRVPEMLNDTHLRSRYEVNDRTSFEINGQYYRQDYPGTGFEGGYQEFRNEDWFNRALGARLSAGLGAAFGWVFPDVGPRQAYQQGLVRAVYLLTEKLYFYASAGVEVREYDTDVSNTVDPVVSVTAIYRPRELTTLTLEAHRREQPSYSSTYNYQDYGFSAGIRQGVLSRVFVGLNAGYDNYNYRQIQVGPSINRVDNYYFVQVRLDYEFNPRWTAGVFYTRLQDDSNEPDRSYGDNMVGLRGTWRF